MAMNKKEFAKVEALYSTLCDSQTAAMDELEAAYQDEAENIMLQLESGVDDFYTLYQGEMEPDELRQRLNDNMKDMTKVQRFYYLSKLFLAVTHVCGNCIESSAWLEMEHENEILKAAIDAGVVGEDDHELQDSIDEMLNLMDENVDYFAVLFAGSSPYEQILEACETQSPEEIQALAANTRQSAVNMACAIWLLRSRGELPSLGSEEIKPHEIGVMAAASLELDAAYKKGSGEQAKAIISKAARACMILLVAAPDLIYNISILSIVGLLTHFAAFWMLVSGAVLLLNAHIKLKNISEQMESVFQTGTEAADVTLDAVKKTAGSVKEWVFDTVLPASIPIWDRCRSFAVNKIIVPAADAASKAKGVIVQMSEYARSVLNDWKERAGDVIDAARQSAYAAEEQTYDSQNEMDVTLDEMDEMEELEPEEASDDMQEMEKEAGEDELKENELSENELSENELKENELSENDLSMSNA